MTTPTTRPQFTLEDDAQEEVSEELLAELRQRFEEHLDELEARGPLTISFPPNDCRGSYFWADMGDPSGVTGMGEWPLQGSHDIGTYISLNWATLELPTAGVIDALPMEHFSGVEIYGADDEIFERIAAKRELSTLDVDAVVHERVVQAAAERAEDGERLVPSRTGGSPIGDKAFSLLTGLDLTRLSVQDTRVTDQTLRDVVESMPQLEWLTLTSDAATFADLSYLAGRALVVLGIGGARFEVSGVDSIPPLPELVRLEIDADDAARLDCSTLLERFPDLHELDLRDADGEPLGVVQTLAVRRMLPGIEINGLSMSAKGVERAAAKLRLDPASTTA